MDSIALYYIALLLLSTWVLAFVSIAAYLGRRATWRILALTILGLFLCLGSLVIQRSPYTPPLPDGSPNPIDLAMTWLQRGSLGLWAIGSLWLSYHLMTLENGRLAQVRKAMLLRPVWRWARNAFHIQKGVANVADNS
jgi:hypothetical protein